MRLARAPEAVATAFREGRITLLAPWLALAQPGHEVFERDRWWCTAPACSTRRNLHRHHIVYRSHRGPDEPWNLTTLCAWHHQRGVHGTGLRIRGRAPDALVFELPMGRFRSGDRRIAE